MSVGGELEQARPGMRAYTHLGRLSTGGSAGRHCISSHDTAGLVQQFEAFCPELTDWMGPYSSIIVAKSRFHLDIKRGLSLLEGYS